jgi:L-ornithine N5-oxygenase
MFYAVQSDLPECRPTLVTRSVGFVTYETSKFTNEQYFPSFVERFHAARPEARQQMLAEMHHTNYSGVAPGMMDTLYRQVYLDALLGRSRLETIVMHDITAARDEGDEVVLELTDRCTGAVRELRTDLILLGTGFSPEMPGHVRRLAAAIGLSEVAVTRDYRLVLDRSSPADAAGGKEAARRDALAACYLHGVNEQTHGISDSLLAVLAPRANDILQDIQRHRAARPVPAAVAAA